MSWLDQLRHRVLEDPELRERLFGEPDPMAFVALVAAEAGVPVEEVEQAVGAARRQWLERWVS